MMGKALSGKLSCPCDRSCLRNGCKNQRHMKTYIHDFLNNLYIKARDFFPILGEITWVRYELSVQVKHADVLIRYARNNLSVFTLIICCCYPKIFTNFLYLCNVTLYLL